uniref:EamA domain-containing protein n=1 Tax=Globisporangium ultimum (strain ATCC 200006 / CBS 805.95 / DAOM BR144) TaxID=431595 RepID=K3WZB2_GLOUD
MIMSPGVSIAVINSIVNALCDPLRKYLTRFMDPFTVVATRGLVQAPLFCLWALIETGGKMPRLNHLFWTSVCISGSINIVTSYLYNRSIQISTLSATVPFLSFTPAFLVIVAFLVLGEVPTVSGVLGISIAMLGGFWLQGAKDDTLISKDDFPLNASNASKGSLYMILVAFLWSISNAFDKIGVQNSTPLVYGATIQVIVAVGSYILQKLRVGGDELYHPLGTQVQIPWKFVILAGFTSVVSYYINLIATQNLEVSYVIAIKRSGCIWSVILGRFLFREKNLRQKIPSILLMVIGVVCIVLGKDN